MIRSSTSLVTFAALATLTTAALPANAAESALHAISPKFERGTEIESALAEGPTVRVIVTLGSGMSTQAAAAALAAPETRAQIKSQIKSRIDAAIVRHFGPAGKVNGAPIVRMSTTPSFSVGLTRAQLVELAKDADVVSIKPDTRATPQLDVSTLTIGMQAAWTAGYTGNGRTLAVIDTGAQTDHPFLGAARIKAEGCFLTTASCPNGTTEQTGTGASYPGNGIAHGTHVSGIALGKNTVSGGTPKMGVARVAKLVIINVFESSGYTYDSSMIRALEYVEDLATANPTWYIRSVNMSIGGSTLYGGYCDADSTDIKAVIDRLRKLKVATVISAGNSSSTNAMNRPGCISSAVSVGATNRLGDTMAYYSNLSPTTRLLAPGGDIYNGGGVVSSVLGSAYEAYQGTSMAAPHVTGAFAALATKYPDKDVSELEDAMRRKGVWVTDTRVSNGLSAPRINVNAAGAFLAAPTAPGNDNFANAWWLTANTSSWGSTSGATRETGEPKHAGSSQRSVWYKLKLTSARDVTIDTIGSNFDTVLAVYKGTSVSALTAVTSNDDASTGSGYSQVTFSAAANTLYYVAAAPKAGAAPGTLHVNVVVPPGNDSFAKARNVTVSTSAPTLVTGTNTFATTETGEPGYHGYESVWWKFTAPSTGTYTIDTFGSVSTTGSSLDTKLAVYTGTSVSGLTLVTYNDDSSGFSQSSLGLAATQGTVYYVAVGSYSASSSGNIRLTFTPPGFVYQRAATTAAAAH